LLVIGIPLIIIGAIKRVNQRFKRTNYEGPIRDPNDPMHVKTQQQAAEIDRYLIFATTLHDRLVWSAQINFLMASIT
jgi:hypothetical protein